MSIAGTPAYDQAYMTKHITKYEYRTNDVNVPMAAKNRPKTRTGTRKRPERGKTVNVPTDVNVPMAAKTARLRCQLRENSPFWLSRQRLGQERPVPPLPDVPGEGPPKRPKRTVRKAKITRKPPAERPKKQRTAENAATTAKTARSRCHGRMSAGAARARHIRSTRRRSIPRLTATWLRGVPCHAK